MQNAKSLTPDYSVSSLKQALESKPFEWTIVALIILNAIIMGMETNQTLLREIGPALMALDRMILIIFTIELVLRLFVYRRQFFSDAWSLFDLTIIIISWLQTIGGLSVLRALRILRILRLISVVPSLRKVTAGLVSAIPGMGSIIMLLLLVYYVFAVMGTNLFSGAFPVWFGSLPLSAYTLFQVMTLEGWSMGLVRPIMEVFPYAWIYFVSFIVCTTFTVLNLFIGIIVSAMSAEGDAVAAAERKILKQDQAEILNQIKELRQQITTQKPS